MKVGHCRVDMRPARMDFRLCRGDALKLEIEYDLSLFTRGCCRNQPGRQGRGRADVEPGADMIWYSTTESALCPLFTSRLRNNTRQICRDPIYISCVCR